MENSSLLPRAWDVPQVFRDRLGTSVGRQRLMAADGHLLLVLHVPPQPDDTERQGRFIWRKPDGSWTSSDIGSGPNVVNKHLDQYAEAISRLDVMEENATSADEYFSVLEQLAPIHRAARNLHRVLQEARQAVPDDRRLINFRDRAYQLERTCDLLHSGTQNALDFAVAKQAEAQAKSSRQMATSAHRLNLLAAFFFPLVTLCGIFGVNLRHGLEDSPAPWALLGMIAVALVTGLVLTGFITRS